MNPHRKRTQRRAATRFLGEAWAAAAPEAREDAPKRALAASWRDFAHNTLVGLTGTVRDEWLKSEVEAEVRALKERIRVMQEDGGPIEKQLENILYACFIDSKPPDVAPSPAPR